MNSEASALSCHPFRTVTPMFHQLCPPNTVSTFDPLCRSDEVSVMQGARDQREAQHLQGFFYLFIFLLLLVKRPLADLGGSLQNGRCCNRYILCTQYVSGPPPASIASEFWCQAEKIFHKNFSSLTHCYLFILVRPERSQHVCFLETNHLCRLIPGDMTVTG